MEQEKLESSKPAKTWFIERGDGHIFATDEHDAWNLLTDKSKWRRHDFKIVGVSDGITYFDIMRKGKSEMNSLLEKKAELSNTFQKYSATEDKLRFTDLKDNDDPMVMKVMKLLSDLQKEIKEVDEKISNFNKYLVAKAFNAELDKARGNIVFPSNHDIITPVQGDRDKIIAKLNSR